MRFADTIAGTRDNHDAIIEPYQLSPPWSPSTNTIESDAPVVKDSAWHIEIRLDRGANCRVRVDKIVYGHKE